MSIGLECGTIWRTIPTGKVKPLTDVMENISAATVRLPRIALRRMLRVVRILSRLSHAPGYRQQVYAQVPAIARFDPGHDAVMMCYDFHLAEDWPRLIEVNTNAGGGLLAYLAHHPDAPVKAATLAPKLKSRLLQTFATEMSGFSSGAQKKPAAIVILDETPEQQHLYVEMQAFADLFEAWGVPTAIADPQQLEANAEGVRCGDRKIDLIYNRHCDFYLESDVMSGLREAYLNSKICLTPNPHMYALLADKRRMLLWSDAALRSSWGLSAEDQALLDRVLPRITLLADQDPEQVWAARKELVFKPVDSYGSKGVLLGEKTTRKRFRQLPPETTLVQDFVPPNMTEVPGHEAMKTDFRLFAYRQQALGITARLYRGQVTNMRTAGGGFAKVTLGP
jgi:hypothetical protein